MTITKSIGIILVVIVVFFVAQKAFDASLTAKENNRSVGLKTETTNSVSGDDEGEGVFLKGDFDSEMESLLAAVVRSKKTQVKTGTSTVDSFSTAQAIDESGSISGSASSRWWVNSGGRFVINGTTAKTLFGDLQATDKWYKEYLTTNPLDTDNGLHPQNIFRLVEREFWKNFSQELYFKIAKYNVSSSPNRNASNGVLLFNRYQSGDSLYYTGIRVDGNIVVKKKLNGTYYTLGIIKQFPGVYNLSSNPNILPVNQWIGLKTTVKDLADGKVEIVVYTDLTNSQQWTESLRVYDTPGVNGSSTISTQGYAGIRTDFMDVEFDNYSISSL